MLNKSRAITLTVRHITSFHQKSVGLIGKHTIHPISFITRWGIHTFGMKSSIDVLILDENHRVVRMTKNLTPNRFFFWNPKYSIVVELPANDIQTKLISLNDQIIFTKN